MHNPVMWVDPWRLFASSSDGNGFVLLDYIMAKYNAANPGSNFSFTITDSWWRGHWLHLTIGSTSESFLINNQRDSMLITAAFSISDMIVFDANVLMSFFWIIT